MDYHRIVYDPDFRLRLFLGFVTIRNKEKKKKFRHLGAPFFFLRR